MHGGDQRGFTLLEVLIAFIIAALAIGVLLQAGIGGLRSTRVASHTEEALSRARSRLAAIGHGAPLAALDQEGDDGGGYRWHVRIVPIASGAVMPADAARADLAGGQAGGQAGGPPAPRIGLYAITVAISWKLDGGNRTVQLESERMAALPLSRQ